MTQPLETPPLPLTPVLTEVLDAIDQAESSAARVRVVANALHSMAFDRVVISLRDASLNSTMVVTAGSTDPSGLSGHALQPLPGSVWRRRLTQLERFRVGELFLLDGSDAWVSREFFAVEPSVHGDGISWLPTDLMIGLLTGVKQERLGIVKMAMPRDGRRPTELLRRDISGILRHLGSRLAYDVLEGLAQRRAERLQRLQEAGAAMARSLDEHEIMRELARQATRATGAEGVIIGHPDLNEDRMVTSLRTVRGAERPRNVIRLGDGIIAEVARTGRPVRIGDRVADRAREKAGVAPPLSSYDVVGDDGPAASMLAVPLLAGIHLIGVLAVHAASSEVFSAEDEDVLATMGSQAATAIANARRYAESERERRQTEALADVARAVSESLRLGEVLRLILRHSVSLLGVEGACIALRQDDYMHIVAAVGAANVLAGVHLPVTSSLIGRSVLENEIIVSNDFSSDPNSSRAVLGLAQIQRTAIAPLITANGTIGAISVINRELPFTDDDARVLQRLSDHVAVAIVNARLFEEVERATREWKVAFDAIASGMVVLDDAMIVKRCNARAAELCGVEIAALIGKPFGPSLAGLADTQIERISHLILQSIAEGVPVREIVRDDAAGRLLELMVALHPDGGCVVTFDDVTTEHQLTERHQRVLETVSDAIVITDLNGNIAFANAAAKLLFQRDDLEKTGVATLTVPEWIPEVQRRERAARSGVHQRYECHVIRADGSPRHVAVSTAALFEVGKVTGTVSCLRDVTERRANEQALARSEANYVRLVDSASDGIFTVDREGRLLSVNRAFLEATGMTRDQLLGVLCTSLMDSRDSAKATDGFARTIRGERQRLELRFTDATGTPRVGMLTTAPILESGHVVGGLGIMRDISADELARETQSQQSRLTNAGELLHAVANELNNPLTSLMALTELELASNTLSSTDRKAMTQIASEAQRVSRILVQLLDATADGNTVDRGFDANRSVQRAIELHGLVRPKGSAPIGTTLPAFMPAVVGDAQRIHQALLNLLSNADDAVSDSENAPGIHVVTRLDGDRVLIEVSDTGRGIAPADLGRVFEPTFTTYAQRGNRGYGLAIARQIVEEHGGRLLVRSSLGNGTTFTLSLPVLSVADAHVSTPSQAIASDVAFSAGADAPRIDAARRGTLLLVEDEDTLRTAIGRYLRRLGYEVDDAPTGLDALARIGERKYDLILLDFRLPDMGGDDVYRELLARRSPAVLNVLFMTGDLSRPSASGFIQDSGCPVIAKPFQLVELDEVIARLVPQL